MKVEIYGIPRTVHRCPGCMYVEDLLKALDVPYEFYPVMFKNPDFGFDKPLIQELAKRAKFPSLNIRYPVIFVDDQKIRNIPAFKQLLLDKGFDPDIIED